MVVLLYVPHDLLVTQNLLAQPLLQLLALVFSPPTELNFINEPTPDRGQLPLTCTIPQT